MKYYRLFSERNFLMYQVPDGRNGVQLKGWSEWTSEATLKPDYDLVDWIDGYGIFVEKYIISGKVKAIFKEHSIARHTLEPIKLYHKGKKIPGYSLLGLIDITKECESYIDFERSVFYLKSIVSDRNSKLEYNGFTVTSEELYTGTSYEDLESKTLFNLLPFLKEVYIAENEMLHKGLDLFMFSGQVFIKPSFFDKLKQNSVTGMYLEKQLTVEIF